MTTPELTSTERAVVGDLGLDGLRSLLDSYARDRLGSPIADVRFRSGRIDVVWGVRLADGREVVIKAHRPPVDLTVRAASADAQRFLVDAGFPCPTPVSGPDEYAGLVLSTETLLTAGGDADGRDPDTRAAIAAGLARHIALLRPRTDLVGIVGKGPAWNRYEDGPWPTPHDPIFDFSRTPEAYRWLDEVATAASTQILRYRGDDVVVGHGDWYQGNLRVEDCQVSATFDWDLIADTEPVIAGMAAACFAASATAGGGLSAPDEVADFLRDYQRLRPFSADERRAAAGATTWILCFNARCELSMLTGDPAPGCTPASALALLHEHHQRYLDPGW